jgi:hypothetical protein
MRQNTNALMSRLAAALGMNSGTLPALADIDSSVFAGFRQVLQKGLLIFALIITILFAMMFYQYQRSAEAVHSVEHTRQVIAYINALRTYLLNLDNAVRQYAD